MALVTFLGRHRNEIVMVVAILHMVYFGTRQQELCVKFDNIF